jgi:hypothetical protein
MFKQLAAATLGLAVHSAMLHAQPPAKETAPKGARESKLDLTPASFEKLHALVRPHEDEWRHLRVHWLTDVVAARRRAAAEDRPIVICYTGGAGYNEPLGVC